MQSQSAPARTAPAISALPAQPAASDRPQPSLSWCRVTPEMAGKWLGQNTDNRPLRGGAVRLYSHQMQAGLWRSDNPDPIIFDVAGRLMNGQHRLSAILDSQCEIDLLIGRDFPLDLRDVLDTGKSRNAPDLLSTKYPEARSQGASYVAAMRGLEFWRKNPKRGPSETGTANYAISNQEIADLWETYGAGLQEVIQPAIAIQTVGLRGGRGLWMTLLYRFSLLDAEKARMFAETVATGARLEEGDPRLVLRNRLLHAEPGRMRTRREFIARLVVNAWNAWRNDETRTRLASMSFKDGKPVEFPQPI